MCLIQPGKLGAGPAADAALFSESLPIYSGVALFSIAGGQREDEHTGNLQALASLGGNNLLKAAEAKSPLSHYSTFPAMETLSCLRGRGGPTHLILQRCCNNSSWKARNRLV